jgi:hypothetical protein
MTINDIYRAFCAAVQMAPESLPYGQRPNTFCTVMDATEVRANNGGRTEVDALAGTFFARSYEGSDYGAAAALLQAPVVRMECVQGTGILPRYSLSFSLSCVDNVKPTDDIGQYPPRTVDQIVSDCIAILQSVIATARNTTIDGVLFSKIMGTSTQITVTPLRDVVAGQVGAEYRFTVGINTPCEPYGIPADIVPPIDYCGFEMRVDDGWVQFRCKDAQWQDLIELSELVGPQGPQGPQGIQGLKGDTGDKGDKGDTGNAATIAVGTVTTGAPGSPATVNNSGTISAAVFDFVIPQGAKGDKGDTGNTGATGPQGIQGNPGANGTNGIVPCWMDTTSQAVTGTTAQVIAGSVLIPAGTFALGDLIEIYSRAWKIGGLGLFTFNLYANTSLAVAGATLLATFAAAASAGLRPLLRTGVVQSAGGLTEFASTGLTTLANDLTSQNSASPIVAVTVDWTQAQYIFVTVQNANSGDTTNVSLLKVLQWRSQ